MFGLGVATKVYVALGPTNMRKGFEGLYGLVQQRLGLDALSGHLFLFANARRTRLKVLVWAGSGLWGMREAFGEGVLSLAERERGSTVGIVEPGGVEFVAERPGPGASKPAALVS
jgi:transposase